MTPVSVRRHRFSALGMSGSCSTEGLSASATTNNQLSGIGVTYDAAGNVTKDNLANTYTYDQENRIATVEGHTYSYDADGTRMEKASESTGTMYWLVPWPRSTSRAPSTRSIFYFNGKRIARVDRPSGTLNYYFSDQLGSASVITGPSGTLQEQNFYYPCSGVQSSTGSDPNRYKFTGKERDTNPASTTSTLGTTVLPSVDS